MGSDDSLVGAVEDETKHLRKQDVFLILPASFSTARQAMSTAGLIIVSMAKQSRIASGGGKIVVTMVLSAVMTAAFLCAPDMFSTFSTAAMISGKKGSILEMTDGALSFTCICEITGIISGVNCFANAVATSTTDAGV